MPPGNAPVPARPSLRPLWMERHNAQHEAFEAVVPIVKSAEALDAAAARERDAIHAGDRPWPPLFDPLLGAPQLPTVFTWRHPVAFKALPDMQGVIRRLATHAMLNPRAPTAHALTKAVHSGGVNLNREADLLLSKHYMHAMWRFHGRRTFYLDPGTAALLLETPLPERGEEWAAAVLRLPHQAFAIALPEGRYFLEFPGDQRPQPVDTLVVAADSLDEDWPGPRELSLLVASRGHRTTTQVDDDNALFTGVALDATPLGALRLRDPGTHTSVAEDLLRLALGTCLYLNSEHPRVEPVPPPAAPKLAGVTNSAKRRRREQQAARESRLPLVWIGRGEWDPTMPLPAPDQTGRSWRLTLRHIVRGHYKRQVHGPGGEGRKVIWVKPYVRGADFAEAVRARAGLVQPAQGRTADPGSAALPRRIVRPSS